MDQSREVRCGCCGAVRPRHRVEELGNTPGTFICLRCAVSATIRLTGLQAAALDVRRRVAGLRRRSTGHGHPHDHGHEMVLNATPTFFSADFDRTIGCWTGLGFEVVERSAGFMLMHADGVELHFSSHTAAMAPVDAFIHVRDSAVLRGGLDPASTAGVGPVQDQPWGLREFVLTDPDGNRIRFGSHVPGDRD